MLNTTTDSSPSGQPGADPVPQLTNIRLDPGTFDYHDPQKCAVCERLSTQSPRQSARNQNPEGFAQVWEQALGRHGISENFDEWAECFFWRLLGPLRFEMNYAKGINSASSYIDMKNAADECWSNFLYNQGIIDRAAAKFTAKTTEQTQRNVQRETLTDCPPTSSLPKSTYQEGDEYKTYAAENQRQVKPSPNSKSNLNHENMYKLHSCSNLYTSGAGLVSESAKHPTLPPTAYIPCAKTTDSSPPLTSLILTNRPARSISPPPTTPPQTKNATLRTCANDPVSPLPNSHDTGKPY